MATPLKGITKEFLLVVSIKGLEERVKNELRVLKPTSFKQTMQ